MLTVAFAGLAAFSWTLNRVSDYYHRKKRGTLLTQMEDLKTEICRLKEGIPSPENHIQELDLETKENNILLEQVKYLTERLQKEEQKTEKILEQCDFERDKWHDYYMQSMVFVQQAKKAEKLANEHLKEQQVLEHQMQKMQIEFEEITTMYDDLKQKYNDLCGKYYKDLAQEKNKSCFLEQQLKQLSSSPCLNDSHVP